MTFQSIRPKTLLVLSALFLAAPGAPLKASRHGAHDNDFDIARIKREIGCPPGTPLWDYLEQIKRLFEPQPQATLDEWAMDRMPSGNKTTKRDKV